MKLEAGRALRALSFGAVAGSVLDGFHTHGGATRYPHPVVWMMAWWVPLLFAFAYALLGFAYGEARTRSGRAPLSWPAGATLFVLFAALYFSSGFLPASNPTKAAVLVAGGLALWAATDRAMVTLAVGLVAALVGPATEVALVHLGVFAHLQPDFLGIPCWLPALYFASAPGAGPLLQRLLGAAPAPARAQATVALPG